MSVFDGLTEDELRDKLAAAVSALRDIARSDPGPAYFVARSVLDDMGITVDPEDS